MADKHILQYKEAWLHDFTKNVWAKKTNVNLMHIDVHTSMCEDYIVVKNPLEYYLNKTERF